MCMCHINSFYVNIYAVYHGISKYVYLYREGHGKRNKRNHGIVSQEISLIQI